MQRTIVICGYGPGIADAVANKFGGEGFQAALVARSADKLEKARDAFQARGVKAAAFATDLSDPNAAQELVKRVTSQLGPVTAIHWNAYASTAGDVMAADAAALRVTLDVSVVSLVLTVQAALADLKASKGAVLATNGGFGLFDPKIDAMLAKKSKALERPRKLEPAGVSSLAEAFTGRGSPEEGGGEDPTGESGSTMVANMIPSVV